MSPVLLIIYGTCFLLFIGLVIVIKILVTKPKASTRPSATVSSAASAASPATVVQGAVSVASLPTKPVQTVPIARTPQVALPEKPTQTTPAVPLPYARIPNLLSAAERDFYRVLQNAVPDGFVLFAQVRLANLIRPTSRNPKQNKYDFYRIQAKCVDFVLCDAATTAPRLVIELDDASHDRVDRKARDSFVDAVLAHVNLPVLHVRWQRSYSHEQLAGDIRQALGLRPALAVEKALMWKNVCRQVSG